MVAAATILVLLAAVAFTAALAKRAPVPLPLVLIAVGAGMSFIPGLERVEIEPHVFFLLFIPPLLFADGWLIPKRELFEVVSSAARASAFNDTQQTERKLVLLALDAERKTLYALRDAGTINDETLRDIETRLDGIEITAVNAARGAHRP